MSHVSKSHLIMAIFGRFYCFNASHCDCTFTGGKELPRLSYKTSWTNTLSTLEGHVHHSSLYSTDHHTLWSELGPLDLVDRSAYLLERSASLFTHRKWHHICTAISLHVAFLHGIRKIHRLPHPAGAHIKVRHVFLLI